MKLYRFSPITTQSQLFAAIEHVHFSTHELSKNIFGHYLQNTGNIAVFAHYDEEYIFLKQIRDQLTQPAVKEGQKYFKLNQPITIAAHGDVPQTVYSYLYIRQPDPYRHHVGDIDFYSQSDEYRTLKTTVEQGLSGTRTFPRADLDMIELYNPDSDVLAYISPKTMEEKEL